MAISKLPVPSHRAHGLIRGAALGLLVLLGSPSCSFYALAPGQKPPRSIFEMGDSKSIFDSGSSNRYYAALPRATSGTPAPAAPPGPVLTPEEQVAEKLWNQVIKEAVDDENKDRPGEVAAAKATLPQLQASLKTLRTATARHWQEVIDVSLQYSRTRFQPGALGQYWTRIDQLAPKMHPRYGSDARVLAAHAVLHFEDVAAGLERGEIATLVDEATYPRVVAGVAAAVLRIPGQPGEAPAAYLRRVCTLRAGPGKCNGGDPAVRVAVEELVLEEVGRVARVAAEQCGECAGKDKLWWDSTRPKEIIAALQNQVQPAVAGTPATLELSEDVRKGLPQSISTRPVEKRRLLEISVGELKLDGIRLAGIYAGALAPDAQRANDAGGAQLELFEKLPTLEQADESENVPARLRRGLNVAALATTPGSLLLEAAFAAGKAGRDSINLVVSRGRRAFAQSTTLNFARRLKECPPAASITALKKGCSSMGSERGLNIGSLAALVVVSGKDVQIAPQGRGRPRPISLTALAHQRSSFAGQPVVIALTPRVPVQRLVRVLDALTTPGAREPRFILAAWR